MARFASVYCAVAVLGAWLSVVGASLPFSAADTPPPGSWTALMAERERAGEQYRLLGAAGKTDGAMTALEELIVVDRRVMGLTATGAAQKKYQQGCGEEMERGLAWLVARYRASKDWSAAAKSQQELADLLEATRGKTEPETIDARNEQAYFKRLFELKPEEAEQLEDLSENHMHIEDLAKRGKFTEAIALAQKAIRLRQRLLGDTSPYLATSCNDLGELYYLRDDDARANPLLTRALGIRKQVLGENHPDYASSLNNLAELYRRQGDYARAEPLLQAALEITKKSLGEGHPDYATGLGNLALLYENQGDYTRSEPLMRESLAITKKALGERHPNYARSLNNCAGMYYRRGDYARAEPLYRQAAEIAKTALGEKTPQYTACLNNLAMLYYSQGDYVRAEPIFLETLEIKKRVVGVNSPDYAASLNNLGLLYKDQRDYTRAEPLFLQALDIWARRGLGEKNPSYAMGLENLALLYKARGDFARAEPLLRKVNDINEATLGTNHPAYAVGLDNLAVLLVEQGDYGQAESLLLRALDINKKVLGENHPEFARTLNCLAHVYEDQADFVRAEPLLRQAVSIQRWHLEATAAVQSERRQFVMLQSVRFRLDDYMALTERHDQFSTVAYQEMLAWKGSVFRRERLARAGEQTPEIKAVFRNLQQVSGQLSTQAWATPGPRKQTAWRENLERLSAEKERIEAELSDRSAAYRQARRSITLEDLRQTLPKDAVLVDFLQYNRFMPADKKTGTKKSWEQRLVAFVVRHGAPIVRVNLGAARSVGEAIEAWRESFGVSPQSAAAGRWLRTNIWEPIEAHLQDAKILLVSPDGALCRLPFAVLPSKAPGKFLLEERAIAVVPAAQMILNIIAAKAATSLPGKLLLVGNIDYDAAMPQQKVAQADAPASIRGRQTGLIHFRPLPGTRDEAAAIERLYRQDFGADGICALQNAGATKTTVLAEAGKHRYVHLATHGFFIDERLSTLTAPTQRGPEDLSGMLDGPRAGAIHPGLRCGLALAGANHSGRADMDDISDDQGLVTADEIASQNLEGVDLVMLSACESGLGKQAAGEGLLSLQRSFQSAGARSVVASLWSVDDAATKTLMVAFYTNLWEKKMSKLEALRQAQLTMLREYDSKVGKLRGPGAARPVDPGKLAAAKEIGGAKSLSPFYWASFVLSGDWK